MAQKCSEKFGARRDLPSLEALKPPALERRTCQARDTPPARLADQAGTTLTKDQGFRPKKRHMCEDDPSSSLYTRLYPLRLGPLGEERSLTSRILRALSSRCSRLLLRDYIGPHRT